MLSYCAFSNPLPERKGARLFEFYVNPENPSFGDYGESSPYTTAFRYLSDAGIIDASLYGSSYDVATPFGESDAYTLLDRMHYYLSSSMTDDFFAYANRDIRIDNCPDEGGSSTDSFYLHNMVRQDVASAKMKELTEGIPEAKAAYSKLSDLGGANVLSEIIDFYTGDDVSTASIFLDRLIKGSADYGYSPLYDSCYWASSSIVPFDPFTGLPAWSGESIVATLMYPNMGMSPSMSEIGGPYYLSLVSQYTPYFSGLLGDETKGAAYATNYAKFIHAHCLAKEAYSESYITYLYTLKKDHIIGSTGKTLGDAFKEAGFVNVDYIVSDVMTCLGYFDLFEDENLDLLKAFALYGIFNHYKALLPDTDVFNAYLGIKGSRNSDQGFYYDVLLPYIQGNIVNSYIKTEEYLTSVSRVLEVVDNLKAAMNESLSEISWLSEEGKAKVEQKLSAIECIIGRTYTKDGKVYEAYEADYSSLGEDSNAFDYVADYDNGYFDSRAADAGAFPEDGDRFLYTNCKYAYPSVINAIYYHEYNSFSMTMGYMFSHKTPSTMTLAELYGRIGSVLAHEIGHAFDASGFGYNEKGEANANWMSEADKEAFSKLTEAYSSYMNGAEVMPGYRSNGEQVLNEAVADNIGISLAKRAASKLEGYEAKEYFSEVAWCHGCYASRGYYEATLTKDEHPWGRVRLNKALACFDDFHSSFNTKEGDFMYLAPENRITFY